MAITAKDIIKKFDRLKSNRANWDTHWREIADYVMPRKEHVFGFQTKGDKKREKIFDSTGPHSLELLASALGGMLTNPATTWFELTTGVPSIDQQDDVRFWLQEANREMHGVLNQVSNFQTEVHEMYMDMGSFGTGLMQMEEDKDIVVRFQARPIFESHVAENNKGEIDTVYIEYKWTLRQIVQEFGEEALNDELRKDLEDPAKANREISVIHAVFPASEAKNEKLPKSFKFASCWVIRSKNHTLKESGFREFPFLVPRWTKVTGEIYGRSPSMKALPDIKMINEVMKTTIRSAQKTIDPPLLLPDDGILLPIKTQPGSLNYKRSGLGDEITPLFTNGRVDFGFQTIEQIRLAIRQAFFVDQLQLNEGPQMTATEVVQRTEEKLRLLGPILARQQFEFLRPLIDRVFAIMLRQGRFSEAPEILQDTDVQVQYSSMIAKAQRVGESQNLVRAMEIVGPLIQADPAALDNIDSDAALRHVFGIFSVPEEILKDSKVVDQERQARAQAQEAALANQQELDDAEKIQKAGPVLQGG